LIPVFVGYDPREAVCYHTFCQSVIDRASVPVAFTPLTGERRDGSNDFTYSRFLVPHLMGFNGWAIYADGDMVCLSDIAELWALRDCWKAVMIVKHDYKTRHPVKYLGAPNEDYPRKNWSSLMLFNCAHSANRVLTPDYVKQATGSHLHRLAWIGDESRIGELPAEWNHLVLEYEHQPAKLAHFTVGSPCFSDYADCDYSGDWHSARAKSQVPCTL
jgi:lipopolysaccharide biosynthesis glycosyltransferase